MMWTTVTVGNKKVGEYSRELGTFRKYVKKSVHLMRMSDAWGIDMGVFDTLPEDTKIKIIETEEQKQYETTKKQWLEHSFFGDYGFGEQTFLSRKYFNSDEQQKLL